MVLEIVAVNVRRLTESQSNVWDSASQAPTLKVATTLAASAHAVLW